MENGTTTMGGDESTSRDRKMLSSAVVRSIFVNLGADRSIGVVGGDSLSTS